MSDMPQEFAHVQKVKNEAARKRLNIKALFFWCTAKKESLALSRMALAADEADFNDEDFARPVRVNLPVVSDLPPEGEIDTTFCDRYEIGGEDGKTMVLLPGATPAAEKVVEGTDTTIVDGVDTATGEIVNFDAAAGTDETVTTTVESGLVIGEHDDEGTRYAVCRMPFRKRLIAQLTANPESKEQRHHLSRAEHTEISAMEMDTDNSYVQNLILAAEQHDELKKFDTPDLRRYTDAVLKVFPQGKRQELSTLIQFTKAWLETDYIDRGLLVKEWAKGNRISTINRTPSGANAGGGNVTDRKTPLTKTGLWYEIALGLLARRHEFDIYNPSLEVDAEASAIMNLTLGQDNPIQQEFVATCKLFEEMPGGMDYSRASNIATVKTTPEGKWESPFRHREHLNRVMTETDHAHPAEHVVDIACGRSSAPMPMAPLPEKASSAPELLREEVSRQLAAERGEFVPGLSDPSDPNWVHEDLNPTASDEGEKTEVVSDPDNGPVMGDATYAAMEEGLREELEIVKDVQVQEINGNEEPAGDEMQPGENALQSDKGGDDNGVETSVADNAAIIAAAAPSLANQEQADVNRISETVSQNSDSVNQIEPETAEIEPDVKPEWPATFEPGRYENVPNDVYHAANGISSTMLKDARISLMLYNARHVEKTIPREETKAFLFGGHSHAFILEPGKIDAEYAVPVAPPADLIRTTADMTAIIKEYNDSLPALMTPDELKAWIEEYNATLTPPLSLSAGAEETGMMYMSIPVVFQRIPPDAKPTATAQKACIKEYNASLSPLLKTSGSREQLLDQIAMVSPDLAEAERAKPVPLNTSGSRAQLIEAVRQIRPDVVLADDFEAEQERIRAGRTYISLDMYQHVKAIEKAVFEHPSASRLLNHPSRQSEVSYFGFDEDTGLEVRVRPDLELQLPHARIGGDLKTIDLGNVKQERLRDRLHREIIERDYHLSAAMYCDVANLDQFYWIFVNKTPGYHWVVVVEASPYLLALGRLEYRRTLRMINEAMETNTWPAPIVEDYTDELNDFDMRRLEALGAM